jgi:hypothetical protein
VIAHFEPYPNCVKVKCVVSISILVRFDFTHELRAMTMTLGELKRKCAESVSMHVQNYVV